MMLIGEHVTIEDMMNCRDRRAHIQQEYLEHYNCPVLSFALNIPGPVKTTKQLHACFLQAEVLIDNAIKNLHITVLDSVTFHDKTGDELLLCFDGNANQLKDEMILLEEQQPLGRLYDIDIIDNTGRKLSRPSFRTCLLCNCQAQECARSRTHSVEDMQQKIQQMLDEAGL